MFLEIPIQLQQDSLEAAQASLDELGQTELDLGVSFKATGSKTIDHKISIQEIGDVANKVSSGVAVTRDVLQAIQTLTSVTKGTSISGIVSKIASAPIVAVDAAVSQLVLGATKQFQKSANSAFAPLTKGLADRVAAGQAKNVSKAYEGAGRRLGFDNTADFTKTIVKVSSSLTDLDGQFNTLLSTVGRYSKAAGAGGWQGIQQQAKADLSSALPSELASALKTGKVDSLTKGPLANQVRKIYSRNEDLTEPLREYGSAKNAARILAKPQLTSFNEFSLQAAKDKQMPLIKAVFAASTDRSNKTESINVSQMEESFKKYVSRDVVFDKTNAKEITNFRNLNRFLKAVGFAPATKAVKGAVDTTANAVIGGDSGPQMAEQALDAIKNKGMKGKDILFYGHSSGGSRVSQALDVLEKMAQQLSETGGKANTALAAELRAVKAVATGGGVFNSRQSNLTNLVEPRDLLVGGLEGKSIQPVNNPLAISHNNLAYLAQPGVGPSLANKLNLKPAPVNPEHVQWFQEGITKASKYEGKSPIKLAAQGNKQFEQFEKQSITAPNALLGLTVAIKALGKSDLRKDPATKEASASALLAGLEKLRKEAPAYTELDSVRPVVDAITQALSSYRTYQSALSKADSKGLGGEMGRERVKRTLGVKAEQDQEHLAKVAAVFGKRDRLVEQGAPVVYPERVATVKAKVVPQGFAAASKEIFSQIKQDPAALLVDLEEAAKKGVEAASDVAEKVNHAIVQYPSKVAVVFNTQYKELVHLANQNALPGSQFVKKVDALKRRIEPKSIQAAQEDPSNQLSPQNYAQLNAGADKVIDLGAPLISGAAKAASLLIEGGKAASKSLAEAKGAQNRLKLAPAPSDNPFLSSEAIEHLPETNVASLTKAQLQKAITASRGAKASDKVAAGLSKEEMIAELSKYSPKQLTALTNDSYRSKVGQGINASQKQSRARIKEHLASGNVGAAHEEAARAVQEVMDAGPMLSRSRRSALGSQLKELNLPPAPLAAIEDDLKNLQAIGAKLKKGAASLEEVFQEIYKAAGGRRAAPVFRLGKEDAKGASGEYHPTEKQVLLSKSVKERLKAADPQGLETFFHEVRHGVQEEAGFKHAAPANAEEFNAAYTRASASIKHGLEKGHKFSLTVESWLHEIDAYMSAGRAAHGANWYKGQAKTQIPAALADEYMLATQGKKSTLRKASLAGDKRVSNLEGVGYLPSIDQPLANPSGAEALKKLADAARTLAPSLEPAIEALLKGGDLGRDLGAGIGNLAADAFKIVGTFKTIQFVVSGLAPALQAADKMVTVNRQIVAASGGTENISSIRSKARALNGSTELYTDLYAPAKLATAGTEYSNTGEEIVKAAVKLSQIKGFNGDEQKRFSAAVSQVIGKGSVQAEEAKGQIGELDPSFMTALAQGRGENIQQLNQAMKSGAVGLQDFQRGLEISGQLAGGQFTNLASETNKLAESWGTAQAVGGEGALGLSVAMVQASNAIIGDGVVFGKILTGVLGAAAIGSAITLGTLTKAAFSAAAAMAVHAKTYPTIDAAQAAFKGRLIEMGLQMAALALATAVVSDAFGSLHINKEAKDLNKSLATPVTREEKEQKNGLQTSGWIRSVFDFIGAPIAHAVHGSDEQQLAEYAKTGKGPKGRIDLGRVADAKELIDQSLLSAQSVADTATLAKEARRKVGPLNNTYLQTKEEFATSSIKAALDPTTANINKRDAASSKLSNLDSDRTEALKALTERKAKAKASADLYRSAAEKAPILAPYLLPAIKALDSAAEKAGYELNRLQAAIAETPASQQKAFYKANQQLAQLETAAAERKSLSTASRAVAKSTAGQVGSIDSNGVNLKVDLNELKAAQEDYQKQIDYSSVALEKVASITKAKLATIGGKSFEDLSSSEVQAAAGRLKEVGQEVDTGDIVNLKKVQESAKNGLVETIGSVSAKQQEYENYLYDRDKLIADHIADSRRKLEDNSLNFQRAQQALSESATTLNIESQISKMKSSMSLANAKLQNKFSGITEDLTGSVASQILTWYETMSQGMTKSLELQLEGAKLAQAKTALSNQVTDFATGQTRAAEDYNRGERDFGGAYNPVVDMKTDTAPNQNYGDIGSRRNRDGSPRRHAGQDYDIDGNQDVKAGISGVVKNVGNNPGGYGNYVDIENKSLGVVERIAEAATILVKAGQTIQAGQVVAKGESSTGVIHREIRTDGGGFGFQGTVDPKAFYAKHGNAQKAEASQNGGYRLGPMDKNGYQSITPVANDLTTKIAAILKEQGSPMKPSDFMNASKASGVSVDALLAQAIIESNAGRSGRANYTKNPINYGNDDAGNDKYFRTFEEGLTVAAKALRRDFGFQTPEQFAGNNFQRPDGGGIYATDPDYRKKYLGQVNQVRNALGVQPTNTNIRGYQPQPFKTYSLDPAAKAAALAAQSAAAIQEIENRNATDLEKIQAQRKLADAQRRRKVADIKTEAQYQSGVQAIGQLKAVTPESDALGQAIIQSEARKNDNRKETSNLTAERTQIQESLAVFRQLIAWLSSPERQKLPDAPNQLISAKAAVSASEQQVQLINKKIASVGGDFNKGDQQAKIADALGQVTVDTAQRNASAANVINDPRLSSEEKLPQQRLETAAKFTAAREEIRKELDSTKRSLLGLASALNGAPVSDYTVALELLNKAAESGDPALAARAKGLLSKTTALQRQQLANGPNAEATQNQIDAREARKQTQSTVEDGQSRVIGATRSAMNDPYQSSEYYSPVEAQLRISENQIQLKQSLQWIDDNAGALGASGVEDLRKQVTLLSQISLKNSISELDSVRLKLKDTFGNVFKSFFTDIKNPDLGVGDIFANLGNNLLSGITDQFSQLASDRMAAMLAQSLPGGNLTQKAGLTGPGGGQISGGVPGLSPLAAGQGSPLGSAGLLGKPTGPASPIPVIPVGSANLGGAASAVGGLPSLLGAGTAVGGPEGAASAATGAGAGPWGMAAVAALQVGMGVSQSIKAKQAKKKEAKESKDSWNTDPYWKPTAQQIAYRNDSTKAMRDYTNSLVAASAAKMNEVSFSAKTVSLGDQALGAPSFTQVNNYATPNVRSFKEQQRQVEASSAAAGRSQFQRLG